MSKKRKKTKGENAIDRDAKTIKNLELKKEKAEEARGGDPGADKIFGDGGNDIIFGGGNIDTIQRRR